MLFWLPAFVIDKLLLSTVAALKERDVSPTFAVASESFALKLWGASQVNSKISAFLLEEH